MKNVVQINMAVIQKTTQPCYRVEKKISENIFLEISSQAILVKKNRQVVRKKMFLMENDLILNDKTDIWYTFIFIFLIFFLANNIGK